MANELIPLGDLVAGWSSDDPAHGAALLQADPKGLTKLGKELRRHLIDALNAEERPAIPHLEAAHGLLCRRFLRPERNKWCAYQLDRDRLPVRVGRRDGGFKNLRHVSTKVPYADQLPALPNGGMWLLIWHGSPDVLEIDGVAKRLAYLRARTRVCDVLFWSNDQQPELYSIAGARGVVGRRRVDFPYPQALAQADPANLQRGESRAASTEKDHA